MTREQSDRLDELEKRVSELELLVRPTPPEVVDHSTKKLNDLRSKLAVSEAKAEAMRAELDERRRVGQMLSNAAFSLGQPAVSLDDRTRRLLADLGREWDRIKSWWA